MDENTKDNKTSDGLEAEANVAVSSHNDFKVRLWFIGIGAFVCLLLAAVIKAQLSPGKFNLLEMDYSSFLAHLFVELGIAGFISIAVILTVEARSRSELKKETDGLSAAINENIFKAVYKRSIPDSVLTELEQCGLRAKVIRRKYDLRYSFGELSGEFIPIDICNIYEVENITGGSEYVPISLMLEKAMSARLADETKVTKVEIDSVPMDEDEMNKYVQSTDIAEEFSYSLQLSAGEKRHIRLEGRLYKQVRDMEVWSFSQPTENIRLTILSQNAGFTIHVRANHSSTIENLDRTENGLYVYEVNRAFVAHQSLVFWWSHENQIAS